MLKRFAVVFDRWNGRVGCWEPKVVAHRGTAERAVRLAQRLGDRHPDLRVTRAHFRRNRSGFEVRDLKAGTPGHGGKLVWEHPGVIVPSVGEIGVW